MNKHTVGDVVVVVVEDSVDDGCLSGNLIFIIELDETTHKNISLFNLFQFNLPRFG